MKFQAQEIIQQENSFHTVEDPAIATPISFLFELTDTILEKPEGNTTKTSIIALAPTAPGGLDYSIAYSLIIPANRVYRITYSYHWDARDGNYIGFYDRKRDINLPMYQYNGGSGYGSRHFTLPAQSEDLEYIIHGHWAQSIGFGGRLPWVQLPAILQGTNTVLFERNPDRDASDRVGWLSWGILN